MADPGLVARMVADGCDVDEARAAVDLVVRYAAAQLAAGKTVRLDGIGQLSAPEKPAWVPGHVRRRARMQRKVALRNGVVIEKGEEYAV